MKRVLLLITLALFTFTVGHAQFDVTTQPGYDAQMEEIYGQAPTSADLPSVLNFSLTKGDRDLTDIKGYGSLIPASGSYSGKLYEIDFGAGTTKTVKNYPSYYFTSAEYVEGTVYVFCNDFTKGFGTVNLTTGTYTKIAKISKGMTDLTYNHNNGKMYGLRYGKIWEVSMTNGAALEQVTTDGNYIAIACDTYGNMFAVTQDATNNAQLVKFVGCNWTSPTVINNDLGFKTQYTQSMAYDHNSDKLIWWQISKTDKHIVEINPASGAVVGTPASTSTSVGGLFFIYSNQEHDITVAPTTGGSAIVNPTSAKKGATITVTVTPENCNEIASVTTEPALTVTPTGTPGVYTFPMPSVPVTVNVTFTAHPIISGVTLAAGKQFLCNTETTTLTATATVEGTPAPTISYDWYKGDTKVATTTTNTYEANAEGTWKVVAKTEHGCDATSNTVAININGMVEAPELTSDKTSVCLGESATITITGFNGEDGDKMVRYINGTAIDTEPVPFSSTWVVAPETEAVYKVIGYQNYMDETLCESLESATLTITVDSPVVEIAEGPTMSACSGSKIQLNATADFVSYLWSGEGVSFTSATANPVEVIIPTVTAATDYTVKVVVRNENECTAEDEIVITVNPLPTVALQETGDALQVCYGGTFTLHVKDADATLYDYQWYKDEVVIAGATGISYSKDNAVDEDNAIYSVVATLKTTGCGSAHATIGINVVESADVPEIDGPSEICYDYTATLDFGYNYEPEDFIFYWYQKEGGNWVGKDTIKGTEPSLKYVTEKLTENTDFMLKVRHIWSQPEGNCWATSEVFTVNVKSNTPVAVQATDGTNPLTFVEGHYNSCYGATFDLMAAEGFKSYQWQKKVDEVYVNIEAEGSDERIFTNEIDTENGDYDYRVVVTDNTECEFHGYLTVRINALPNIVITEATIDPETEEPMLAVCAGVTTTLHATGADTYEWGIEPGDDVIIDSTTLTTPNLVFSATGEDYIVWLTGANTTTGCRNSTIMRLHVNPLPALAITSPVDKTVRDYDMIEGMIDLKATIDGEEAGAGVGTYKLDGNEYEGTQIDLMLLTVGEHTLEYTYSYAEAPAGTGCEKTTSVTFNIADKKYWSDADIRQGQWYEDVPEDRYEIGSAEEYGYFLYLLNDGIEDFDGKIIHIVNDIDLGARFVKPHTGFKGTLEGYGKIISNYTVADNLTAGIANYGVIRNLGIKDAKIYMTTTTVQGNFANYGSILNSYITASTFRFMGEQSFSILNAAGAKIQNVYLADSKVLDKQTLTVTNAGDLSDCYSKPAVNFGGIQIPEFTDAATLMSKLNDWTNDQNTAEFIDWRADQEEEGVYRNYGYPVHEEFMHMVHYNVDLMHVLGGDGDIKRSHIEEYEDGTYDLIVKRGKEKGFTGDKIIRDTTIYGFAYDTVTVNVNPDLYCKLDSLNVLTDLGVEVEPYEVDGYIYFKMPVAPLEIYTNISKDYWTDADYADFEPFALMAEDRYEIGNAAQLAALARIVNGINLPTGISQNNFAGKEIHLENDIDLTGHMWKPIDGFKGTFEGYGKYISNMRTIDDAAALFANLGNGALVRNLGVTDAYIETSYVPEKSAQVFYSENFESTTVGQLPTGWTGASADAKVIEDADKAYSGTKYLSVEWNASKDYGSATTQPISLQQGKVLVSFYATYNHKGGYTGSDGLYLSYRKVGAGSYTQIGLLGMWSMQPNAYNYYDIEMDIAEAANYEFKFDYWMSKGDSGAAICIDDFKVMEAPAGNGGAAIAVNNAGTIMNCYVTNAEINGSNDVTGIVVANNAAGAQVKNVYGGKIKSNVDHKFIAQNNGTSASNYAETEESVSGVTKFTDKEQLAASLNTFVEGMMDPKYFPWRTLSGTNYDYPIFTENPHYYIAYTNDGHGTASGLTHAEGGTEINVTTAPNTGYELATLTASYTFEGPQVLDIKESKKFDMPGANVTVNATFTMINWGITYNTAEHGTITGPATGNYGQEITVTVTPETGYELVKLMAGDEDITASKKFTMPNSAIEITATFDGVYKNIAVTPTENGTLIATPADKQRYTHEVTVAYSANNGYVIDKILVTNTDDVTTPAIDITESKKFDMPLYNVTITATFKEGFWTDDDIRDITWYDPTKTEYHITTAHQLGGLSYLVNGFDNGTTEDIEGPISFEGVTFYIDNAIDMHVYKWRPIGGQLKTTYTFKGTFEGNGYAITDMTIDDPKGSYQAFFGVNDGVINNVNIHGTSYGKYWVAGLVGKNNGTVRNCVSNVKVKSVFEAAGIAANNIGLIENCYNRGNIENTSANFGNKASLNVGGITATNAKTGVIKNVYNVGEFKGTGSSPVSYFGGIVGKNTTGGVVMNAYWLNNIVKGCGSGKIDETCKSFTPEYGQAADKLLTDLNNYTESSAILLKWGLNTEGYLYPVFLQNTKSDEITGIDENGLNVNLYPNPAKSYVRVECEGIQRISVVNALGQIMIDQNYDTDNVILDIHTLIPGVYTVNIVTVNGNTTRNIVVTR